MSRETISLAFLAAIQLPITANGQSGVAGYLRRVGQTGYFPFVLTVLRIDDGRLADIAAFEQSSMFTAFGLPASL